MISVQLPPEVEQQVRAVAEREQRDPQEVAKELLRDAAALARRRAFNEGLKRSLAQGLAGETVSEEELFADLDEE